MLLGGKRHCERQVSCLKTTQCPRPGLEPRLLDPETGTLTMKSAHLHKYDNYMYMYAVHAKIVRNFRQGYWKGWIMLENTVKYYLCSIATVSSVFVHKFTHHSSIKRVLHWDVFKNYLSHSYFCCFMARQVILQGQWQLLHGQWKLRKNWVWDFFCSGGCQPWPEVNDFAITRLSDSIS